MALSNLMEEIVMNIANEIAEKEGSPEINRDDIVAYVLNRIAPQYVTSERGILHGQIASKYKIQQKADIILYIYEALDVINKRRGSISSVDGASASNIIKHFIGELAESESLSPVADVKVTLLFNGQPAKMVNSSWTNPYVTNIATKGYYHFWPVYDENTMKGMTSIPFRLKFEHPDYETLENDIEIDVNHNKSAKQTTFIPMVLLNVKK